ncbi:MAG: hypothetical protein EA397_09990 [Deltaproteobacteria bacterium]|nr:MAG: hypothetical protein EA397_09990 [Deltaproteobacteria bacterium]
MATTLTLHTTSEMPGIDNLARWLTEQGEPYELDEDRLVLRAIPLSLDPADPQHLVAQAEVQADLPLTRLVDLIFDLSVLCGADVLHQGRALSRAGLWLLLADEQDRLRIAAALDQASERGNADEVLRRLWAVLNTLYPSQDIRWNADLHSIVQVIEVGAPGGLPLEEAADHELGDLVPRRLSGTPHLLAWRWMSEAYPSLSTN